MKSISVSVLSVVLSFVVIALFLLILGKNPLKAMGSFLSGCGFLPKAAYAEGKGMPTDFMSFLDVLAPMLLASLGVVVALKAGLFNIGVAGRCRPPPSWPPSSSDTRGLTPISRSLS
jgi:simple sugar transport system permease protein